jgi:hypothetical protein
MRFFIGTVLLIGCFIGYFVFGYHHDSQAAIGAFHQTEQVAIRDTPCENGSIGFALVPRQKFEFFSLRQEAEVVIGGEVYRSHTDQNHFRIRFIAGGIEIYEADPHGRYIETVASCPIPPQAKH